MTKATSEHIQRQSRHACNRKSKVSLPSTQDKSSDYNAKRRENKRKALLFKLTITGFSGATTVLLGLQGIGQEYLLRNTALLLSAWVTLLSTWDSFFNHRGLWASYTTTCAALRAVESDLEYLLLRDDGMYTEEQTDKLYERYQAIIQETNQWWQRERSEDRQPS